MQQARQQLSAALADGVVPKRPSVVPKRPSVQQREGGGSGASEDTERRKRSSLMGLTGPDVARLAAEGLDKVAGRNSSVASSHEPITADLPSRSC